MVTLSRLRAEIWIHPRVRECVCVCVSSMIPPSFGTGPTLLRELPTFVRPLASEYLKMNGIMLSVLS